MSLKIHVHCVLFADNIGKIEGIIEKNNGKFLNLYSQSLMFDTQQRTYIEGILMWAHSSLLECKQLKKCIINCKIV